MQTVGRKGRQELSSEGRERGSKDWSGASGAVVAGGSPAGSGAQRQQEWLQGVDRPPGCVLPARGGSRGCVLRMALLKDMAGAPVCQVCAVPDLWKAPLRVHRLHHPRTQGGWARADAGEQVPWAPARVTPAPGHTASGALAQVETDRTASCR